MQERKKSLVLPLVAGTFFNISCLVEDGMFDSTTELHSSAASQIADGWVSASAPNTNYGTDKRLIADGSPARRSYLKFHVADADGVVDSATLRLYVRDPSANGPAIYAVSTSWTESNLTWNTRPSRQSGVLDDVGATQSGSWIEYDVTEAVSKNGTYAFEVYASSGDGSIFQSREADYPPELIVDWHPAAQISGLVADARVEEAAPNTNFGAASDLLVDTGPASRSYLKFHVGDAASGAAATLRLYVRNPTSDGPAVYAVGTGWSESGLTWNNRPARKGGVVANVGAIESGRWVEYDVSAAVSGNGTYAFEIFPESNDGASFQSKEAEFAPELVIASAASLPPAPSLGPTAPPPSASATVAVKLVPRAGFTGTQRINFAVPLAEGQLVDASRVRVMRGSSEVRAGRRGLARYADGSYRSVQIQADVSLSGETAIEVRIGEVPSTSALSLVSVASTLSPSDGTRGPKVWALLPARVLATSGVAGPQLADADVPIGSLKAWESLCDSSDYSTDDFLAVSADKGSWLYDRATTLYRGYARGGSLVPLESAYRESSIYRNAISGTGTSTRIGVPGASSDLKYHYTQGMAIHYLLTGDDRFRESVEDVATRIRGLWGSPGYAGGADFWTERHAGFALLGYVWAAMVSDDRQAEFSADADAAVDSYYATQATYPTTWKDASARCFAHSADAHGESYGTWGCSPWMSAILADGLDAYAAHRGGTRAGVARDSIVKLGRILARGRPRFVRQALLLDGDRLGGRCRRQLRRALGRARLRDGDGLAPRRSRRPDFAERRSRARQRSRTPMPRRRICEASTGSAGARQRRPTTSNNGASAVW